MKKKIGEFMAEYLPFFILPVIAFWIYFALMAESTLGILGYMTGLGFSIMILLNIMEWE